MSARTSVSNNSTRHMHCFDKNASWCTKQTQFTMISPFVPFVVSTVTGSGSSTKLDSLESNSFENN